MSSVPAVLSRRPRFGRSLTRERALTACDHASVLLLTAPAGCGKSVLAGQICDRSDRKTIWCRLAEGYADAADLVAMAAQSAGIDAGDIGLATDVLTLASSLLELLEAEPVVMVVDDYDRAEGDRCDQLLAEVFALLPRDATVVVAGRTRPAALLGRIAGLDPVVLDGAHLAFDTDEAASLFALHDRPTDDPTAWVSATGGWATAMALVAEGALVDLGRAAGSVDVAAAFLEDARLIGHRRLLKGLAVLPYLTNDLAIELELGSREALTQLGALTSMASDSDGYWRGNRGSGDGPDRRVGASTASGYRHGGHRSCDRDRTASSGR
jgi:ATP/maltotriose-dependent transcriptional regulator MalT